MSDSPDSPPPVEPAEPVVPTGNDTTGLPRNIAAALACFFSLVGGIVFLIVEKKDPFVRFYAMQSLLLGGISVASSIALQILSWVLSFVPFVGKLFPILFALVGFVVGLAFFVAWVVSIWKAFKTVEWEIPVLGKIAREQLAARTPGVV